MELRPYQTNATARQSLGRARMRWKPHNNGA